MKCIHTNEFNKTDFKFRIIHCCEIHQRKPFTRTYFRSNNMAYTSICLVYTHHTNFTRAMPPLAMYILTFCRV